jgi:mannosyltransferase
VEAARGSVERTPFLARLDAWTRSGALRAMLPVVALTLVAFLLRRYHLGDESFWFDEADIVARARQPLPALLNGFTQAGENGPLYTLILHFWLRLLDTFPFLSRLLHALFGMQLEGPVRALAMLAGTATIPVIYLFGRRVGGHAVGLISAALLALNPFHIWHSQDAKMYTLLVLAALVSSLLYLKAWERNTWGLWLAYVVATWVMLTSHGMALLVLLAQLAATPFMARPEGLVKSARPVESDARRSGRLSAFTVKWGWAMLLILGPIFPLAWLRLAALVTGTADVGGWYAPAGLNDILGTLAVSYAVNRSEPLWEWTGALSLALVVLAGLLALYLPGSLRLLNLSRGEANKTAPAEVDEGISRGRARALPLLIAMLVLPVLGFWVVTLKIPLFQARYLIMGLPAYLVLAAVGLWALWRRSPALAVIPAGLLALASGASLISVNYSEQAQKEDWRGAVAYVMDHTRLRDAVVVFPGYLETAVDLYYTPGGPGRVPEVPIKSVPSLLTEGFGDRELHTELFEAVKCHERAWLVTSPVREEQEDPTHRVRQWFQYNWRTFDTREFNGVTVYGVAFNGQPDCWYPQPTSPERHEFENGITFLGYIYEIRDNAAVQPDASYFPLTLYWRSPPERLTTNNVVRVRIKNASGEVVKDETLPPHNGFWPTTEWPPDTNIIDYRDLRLEGGMEPGDYTVTVQLHPEGEPDKPLQLAGGGDEIVFQEPLKVVPWQGER